MMAAVVMTVMVMLLVKQSPSILIWTFSVPDMHLTQPRVKVFGDRVSFQE